MKPIVRMTGPHPSRIERGGCALPPGMFRSSMSQKPQERIYSVLSYRRAMSLSCNMARDRKLFLHMEALPPEKLAILIRRIKATREKRVRRRASATSGWQPSRFFGISITSEMSVGLFISLIFQFGWIVHIERRALLPR